MILFLLERPIVFLLLMAIPLFALAYFRRAFPDRRMLLLFALPAMVALAQIFFPMAGLIAVGLLVLVALACLVDVFTLVSQKQFSAVRNSLKVASLGKPHDVNVELTNLSSRTCEIDFRDDIPDEFSASIVNFPATLKPKSKTRFKYTVTSSSRGKFEMDKVYLAVNSRLGLWQGFYQVPCQTTINVYPDMKQIAEYDLLARTNRLSQMGVRRVRRIGQDNEFERLRDYTKDDNYKHIDWRTSARRRKLTVKDFQSNQSQRIIFMVDCARMMAGSSDAVSYTHLTLPTNREV